MTIEWEHVPASPGMWATWGTRINDKHVLVLLANKDLYVFGNPVNGRLGYYVAVDHNDSAAYFPPDTPLEDVKKAALVVARMS